jgi:transposase
MLETHGYMLYNVAMHIDAVPNRGSRPTYLLRESYRDGKNVRKRTLANLSALSDEQIESVRAALSGKPVRQVVPVEELFNVLKSRAHGHVQAVRLAMKQLDFESLISSDPSPERDVVCAMVAARVIEPNSKLGTQRWWHTTTIPDEFGAVVSEADEDTLYEAMDWLLEQQQAIEGKLAAQHLTSGGLALYDLSSSYFEGTQCPLGKLGYSRDGKKGTLQVNYGLLTAQSGCPVAVSVYEGNSADSATLMPQVVNRLRNEFALEQVVVVGDRGMISQKAIAEMRELPGLSWITALKSGQIRALVEGQALQLGLFDERSLFELSHDDYPGERLMACRNPELMKLRARKRQALLQATQNELEKVRARVQAGKLRGKDKIGVRVGRVINKYKVAKHFELVIEDRNLDFKVLENQVAAEAALDGVYVIRTNVSAEKMTSDDAVRSYKGLSEVERAFRSLKTVDLKVRPIRHYLEDRVRAHIFLCMLAYYVEWHMIGVWRELLFADEDLEVKRHRDPVAPAKRSANALHKIATRKFPDGSPVHSLRTLLQELGTIVRNTCVPRPAKSGAATFDLHTTPNATQQRALELLQRIAV